MLEVLSTSEIKIFSTSIKLNKKLDKEDLDRFLEEFKKRLVKLELLKE